MILTLTYKNSESNLFQTSEDFPAVFFDIAKGRSWIDKMMKNAKFCRHGGSDASSRPRNKQIQNNF